MPKRLDDLGRFRCNTARCSGSTYRKQKAVQADPTSRPRVRGKHVESDAEDRGIVPISQQMLEFLFL